jgi:IS30 family transposase
MHAQITFEERVRIEELLGEKYLPAEIAKELQRHPGSIGRELLRNEIGGQYSAKMAQALTQQRRRERPLVRKMERPEIREPVVHGLSQQWSPDEICGRQQEQFAKQPERHVSASTIYRWIEHSGPLKSHWKKQLRHRGRARWVPRKPAKRPGQPIRNRPRIIEKRRRLGDFEGDLVVGPPGTGGVLTLVCRKSRYLRVTKVHNKTARHVHKKYKRVLSSLPPNKRHSTTFDNGTEFARCHLVEISHGTSLYFAEPGCPHQRGTNENTNGLLRQYFPKGTDFTTVTHQELRRVENLMNNRPRRCLGYRTPAEVFLDNSAISNCN